MKMFAADLVDVSTKLYRLFIFPPSLRAGVLRWWPEVIFEASKPSSRAREPETSVIKNYVIKLWSLWRRTVKCFSLLSAAPATRHKCNILLFFVFSPLFSPTYFEKLSENTTSNENRRELETQKTVEQEIK